MKALSAREMILDNKAVTAVTATHTYLKDRAAERAVIRLELLEKQRAIVQRMGNVPTGPKQTGIKRKTGKGPNGFYADRPVLF